MDIHNLIPIGDPPKSGVPASLTTKWWGLDTEEEYRRRGGHPAYDENSIEYRFNSHGFRCPEFTERADIRMISIGCSNTAGQGLPQQAIFHERFAERLRSETGKTVVNWNLGQGGTGNDVVERVLQVSVPVLDPHIVLILFTEFGRREYVSPRGLHIALLPGLLKPDAATRAFIGRRRLEEGYSPEMKVILGNLACSSCEQDDELRFFRIYKSISNLLSDRCWLFGFIDKWPESRHVFKHTDAARYAGYLERMDLARDCAHYGPYSHEALYKKYWNAFERLKCKALGDLRGIF